MGFEELASELHKGAEAEGRKIIRAAEANAEKIISEAGAKAEEGIKAARKDASSIAKQEAAERITSAKLAAKKTVDEAKDEAVEATLHQAWQHFKSESLKKSNYPAIISRLVREGVEEIGTRDAVVFVRDEDKPLVSGFKLSRLPSEYCGGAIIETMDGKVRVNKTLEEAFSAKKPGIRKMIYDKLF